MNELAVITTRRRLPTPRPELAGFAKTLNQALKAKGMTPSDLARAVWGTTRDYRGYLVAKNRDRIGNYLAGVSYPGADNLKELARALGLKVEDLAVKTPPGEGPELRGQLDVTFTMLPQPNMAVLAMRKIVSVETGLAVLQLLKDDTVAGALAHTE